MDAARAAVEQSQQNADSTLADMDVDAAATRILPATIAAEEVEISNQVCLCVSGLCWEMQFLLAPLDVGGCEYGSWFRLLITCPSRPLSLSRSLDEQTSWSDFSLQKTPTGAQAGGPGAGGGDGAAGEGGDKKLWSQFQKKDQAQKQLEKTRAEEVLFFFIGGGASLWV